MASCSTCLHFKSYGTEKMGECRIRKVEESEDSPVCDNYAEKIEVRRCEKGYEILCGPQIFGPLIHLDKDENFFIKVAEQLCVEPTVVTKAIWRYKVHHDEYYQEKGGEPPPAQETRACGACAKWMTPECSHFDDAKKGILLATDTACSDFSQKSPPQGDYFDDHGKFIPALLAEELMSEYHFITMMDSKEIYVYLDGYYQPYGKVIIRKECKGRLGEEYRKNRATEVLDYIEASTYKRRREEPPNLLPLENGVLDLDTMELKPYSPDLMFFNKIPVNYDPEADCPEIKKFHKEITGGPEDVTVLEEILGFCLYRDYLIAKALMLVGGGSNGKSTWLSLAKTFLGPKNVCGRSLQDLEEHRFAKADLHAKLANIYADLPDKALFRTGMFKMLTGRDLIAAEKKFRDSFHFVNYAKLMFSANKVPEAYDDTVAFFRRWIIIVLPNVFTGEDADPHILDKLTTEEELSGLLNLALSGLKRLLEKGQFSHSKTTEEIKEDYVRKSSPITAFIMDCMETDSDAFIVKKELFNEFAEYCRGRSLPTVTQDTFYKNLPQHVAIADFRPRIEGRRLHTFKGIRYKADGWSRVFEAENGKEAQNGLWSNRSNRSRVFYTLITKRDEYKEPYQVTELNDASYIKISLPLDRLDRLDQGKNQGGKAKRSPKTLDRRKKKPQMSLGEKLEEIKTWIIENKDSDSLIDSTRLAEKITELGEKPQEIVEVLKKDDAIAESPRIGRWLVVK